MKYLIKARALIVKDDKIFLVRYSVSNWKYMLPWWKMEAWETIKETLLREIKEELWIAPEIDKFLWFREYINKIWDITLQFLFVVKNVDDYLSIDKSKCSHWFEWDEWWFFSIQELKENNLRFPDDLEDIYMIYLGKNNYNTFL